MTRSMQVHFQKRPATQPLTVRDDWSIDGRRMSEIILQTNPTIQSPNRTVRSVQHNDSGLRSAISVQHNDSGLRSAISVQHNDSGLRSAISVQHNDSGLRSAISIKGMHQSTRYVQVADSGDSRVIIILCMPYLVIIVN